MNWFLGDTKVAKTVKKRVYRTIAETVPTYEERFQELYTEKDENTFP